MTNTTNLHLLFIKGAGILIFIFFFNTFTFSQIEKSYEEKYQITNTDLPNWVKMMYSDNPNIKAVMKAYEEYYQTHPFEKNTYTQYYKRWIRDKWIYLNKDGFVNKPSPKQQELNLNQYKDLVTLNKTTNTSPPANWEELGPWEYDHEATMNLLVQSPGSAHVYTVEQSQSNPDIIFAGTANAGVWKSTDKGISWTSVTADLAIREVYSIEIDHTNADNVYCYSSSRIWKTSNGGDSWSETGGGQYFSWTRDLRMHPSNNQILMAATTDGFYRTIDAGISWTKILGGHFQEIEFHPTNNDIVYLIKQIGNRTEFYKSTDAGLTFTLKPTGWPGIASSSSSGIFTSANFDNSSYASFNNVNLGNSTYPNFTIEMWVKSSGWSGDPSFISNKNWGWGGNKGFILAANGNGWKFNIGDGSNRIDLNGSSINDNLWHHIAITYEANGDKKLYQDGVLINTSSASISTDTESGLNLAIAQDGTLNYGLDLAANFAEVRIWQTALSESQIGNWFCQTVDNTHPTYASLLHHWKMNDGIGTNINDAIGNNNGTINGSSSWISTNEMTCIESSLSGTDEQKRVELAVSAAAPDNVYVLATGSANGGEGLYGFYKSTNSGESFSFTCCGTEPGGVASLTNKNIVGYSYELTSNGGQYYYDLGLGVSPTNADKIMAAGISVIRSENGGVDWETNGHWVTWVGQNTTQRYTHADVHDVKFFQNGANVDMWVASDGGLYYSSNQGDNIEPRMHGIQGTEFWGFGASYKKDAMIGGTYHNGTLLHYEDVYDKGKNGHGGWFAGGAGDATKGDVHDAYGSVMFEGGGMMEILNRQVYWKWLPFDNTKNANMHASAGQYGNYEWHPYLYHTFYSPVEAGLWKTDDNGVTWNLIHDFGNGKIYTVKVSVADPDIIYVIHNDDIAGTVRLWKTSNGGTNWTDITPSNSQVGNNNYKNKIIDIDQDNPDNIWLLLVGSGTGNKVFSSIDGGTSWSNWTGSVLNNEVVLDIVHHQGTDGGIYVGTNNSVFYRNNAHSDWQLFNDGLPLLTRCGYLHPYYTEGKIRVGTYRGAFQSDLFEDAAPTARLAVDKVTSNCNRDTFYFKDLSYVDHSNVSWAWTFDGGTPSTSTEENPKVVFSEGVHNVSLTVTNAFGSDSQSFTDFISIENECIPDTIPGNGIMVAGTNSSYARASHAQNLNFGSVNDFTISAWIKTTTTAGDAVIIAKKDWDTGLNPGWIIATQNGKLWINLGDGSNRIDIVPSNLINDGEWHHIAVSFDRTNEAVVYLNGRVVGNSSITNIGNIDNTLEMVLGADSEYDYPIEGFFDEICIYNKALTQSEIREVRHLTKKAGTANLVSYFQFNEISGKALDRIGTNHLTLSNTASRSGSSCPIGGGSSSRIDVSTSGTTTFSGTGVTMNFPNPGTYPNGELVVSRINQSPDFEPNVLQKDVYWVVNNYGNNNTFTPLTSIQFDQVGPINSSQTSDPSGFELYKRGSNQHGNTWGNSIDIADAATQGSNGSITFSTNNNISNFSQFAISNASPLPVEWLSFNTTLHSDRTVHLDWKVGVEIDNYFYSVERSKDGINFIELSQIPSLNNSNTEKQYQFIDNNPVNGINYYRIKQVDFDHSFTYSNIQNIVIGSSNQEVLVFPNPVLENTYFTIQSNLEESLDIDLFDSKGKLISSQSIFKEGQVSTKNLSPAVYFYKIKGKTIMKFGKILVKK